jgi:phage repressor protein C with HTH and peptisase S24 domain
MDVYALRRARLAILVEKKHRGNIAAFARDYGYSRAQISQFLSETYNGGRSIGERAARTIESRCGYDRGWLDTPLSDEEMRTWDNPFSTAELRVITDRPLAVDTDPMATSKTVARIPIQTQITPAADGFAEGVDYPPSNGSRFIDFYAPSDTAVALQVKGSALRPRIKHGDYLLADSSITPSPGDDVIVTFVDDRMAILQWLYSRDGEIALGNVNGSSTSIVVPVEQITFVSVTIGIIHSSIKTTNERS